MKRLHPKGISGILVVLLLFGLLGGCKKTELTDITSVTQLNDGAYTVGVPAGATAVSAVETDLPKAKMQYYNSLPDAYLAVQQSKVDAFAFDSYLLQFAIANGLDGVKLLDGRVGKSDEVGIGITRKSEIQDLQGKINDALETLNTDGTLDEMFKRWVFEANGTMPDIPKPENPTMKLKVATSGTIQPFSYYEGDKLTGYDLELTARLALILNAEVELKVYDYAGFPAAMEAGAIDCVLANLNATDERREVMDFSTPIYLSKTALLVRDDGSAASTLSVNNARLGVMTGSGGEAFSQKQYPDSVILEFNNYEDSITALSTGKLDYAMMNYTDALQFLQNHKNLEISSDNLTDEKLCLAIAKNQSELYKQVSDVLRKYLSEGTIDEISSHWISPDGKDYLPPNLPKNADAPIIKVAVSPSRAPMTFMLNDAYAGLDIELIDRILFELGYQAEYINMEPSAMPAAIESGLVDMTTGILITPELEKKILLTETYFQNPQVILKRNEAAVGEYTALSQIPGKTVGVQSGSVFAEMISEVIPDVTYSYYNSRADLLEAVKSKKVDAIALDKPVAELAVAQSPSLVILPEQIFKDSYGICLALDSPLTAQVNSAIAQLREDGTLKTMKEKWTGKDQSVKILPTLPNSGSNGVLRVAHDTTLEPMCYVSANGAVGYDLELMLRIGQILERKVEFASINFNALVTMLQSGKADAVVSCLSITEERRQVMDMSDTYYDGGTYLVVRRAEDSGVIVSDSSFFENLQKSFIRTFVTENRWKLVLNGLEVTVLLSVLSGIFGSILGFGICMLRRSKHRGLSIPTAVAIRLVQGTPIVVLLMILYYIIFGDVDVSAIGVAVFGFSVNFGVYVSEMMRTGIDAVDKGQIEAARAIGLTRFQAFSMITFPQAARHFLPVFEGEFISMVKMTSVVGYIAIQDLTKVSDIIRGRTLEAFFPLIATAVIYFLVANVMILLISYFKKRLEPNRRNRTVKGVVTQ